MLTVYRREASQLISRLPKGSIRSTNARLRGFVAAENDTLRRWYSALQMRLLHIAEFEQLMARLGKQLKFDGLQRKGLESRQVRLLIQELLSLFCNICGECSGITRFCETYPDYKVRIYTLRNWGSDDGTEEWEDLE